MTLRRCGLKAFDDGRGRPPRLLVPYEPAQCKLLSTHTTTITTRIEQEPNWFRMLQQRKVQPGGPSRYRRCAYLAPAKISAYKSVLMFWKSNY
jgi:hypothetical protein